MITIPVYDIILFPGVSFYFRREIYEKWNLKDAEKGQQILFLLMRTQKDPTDLQPEDYYTLGFSAVVEDIDPEGIMTVRVLQKVSVSNIRWEKETILADIAGVEETEDLPEEEKKARFERIRADFLQFIAGFQWGVWVRGIVMHWESVEEMVCGMAGYLTLSQEDKLSLMEENSVKRREERLEDIVYEFMEGARVSEAAQKAQQSDYEKIYRESALKKQIEYLQKELDDLHPENISDVRKFELKIQESGMNDAARKEAEKVLNRMKQEGQNGHEYGMLYDYLDFVTTLSWKPEELPPIDLEKAEQILEEDHYGLQKVKDRIIQQLAVMALNRKQSGSILLFVGAPGTGKTSIGQSIARALGRPYARISLGGVRDEAEIRGHRRTYIGAMPGRIMEGMKRAESTSPVMVLDEVDKLSKDYAGDPASALLEVLDPEQNSNFTDHYMNVPYDLSGVLFVCTANTTDSIPEPLLNRMEVIQFPGYTETEKYHIAVRHLLPRAKKEAGIRSSSLKITEDALHRIIADYTMESGVRGLKKQLDMLCRNAAVRLVRNEQKSITVGVKRLEQYLGRPNLHHDRKLEEPVCGTVTGLAWTSGGGEILFIETRLNEGDGELTVTGQLGDVMKESVQIALSVARSLCPKESAVLKDHDLHLHVPAGAVPKDGPSAGITIATAIVSLLTGRSVRTDLAMTGELSLRGKVLPIGGLPEKLMAALRAGIRSVMIPASNMEDLKDVSDEVKSRLNIIPVSDIREVLEEAFREPQSGQKA